MSEMQYRFIRHDGTVITLRDEKASLKLGQSDHLYYTIYKDVTRVRNIRQRMFEKFNVSNSIELINKTAHFG